MRVCTDHGEFAMIVIRAVLTLKIEDTDATNVLSLSKQIHFSEIMSLEDFLPFTDNVLTARTSSTYSIIAPPALNIVDVTSY